MLLKPKGIALIAIMGMAASCANEEEFISQESQIIEGIIEVQEDPESRVSVDPESLDGKLVYYWNPSDEIGVFTNKSENNVKYVNTNQNENVSTVSFEPTEGITVNGTPTYAYFPYSATAGTNMSSLSGNLPQNQVINATMDNIPGIYRYGYHKSTSSSVSKFGFKNIFSIVRFKLDASGTELEGENLKDLDITVTRSGSAVPVCGDFTFNARYGTYTRGNNTSNTMNIKFEGEPMFDGKVIFLTSMFPTVRKNDIMSFTLRTTNYTATFDVKSLSYFTKNYTYTYSVSLSNATNLVITKNESTGDNTETPEEGGDEGEGTEGEGTEGTVATGTFTCATYNVDGLPQKISIFTINGDGPGSDGTQNISQKMAQQNWDFVGFSEDFAYHSELTGSMSNYTFGTHRGSVSSISGNDTDGLGFATKNTSCSFGSTESWTQFTSSAGGITSGANTCIKKGFRHYVVTLADGVAVDVLITHMNTYSSSGTDHINAQHAQLTQIAQYINTISTNNRPIILMGDTNCRYTRHDFNKYFWSVLNSDLTYADPWVEFQWNGVYPTYPSKSLMVSDATGTNADTDIICSTTQNGEVVDKVIYINKTGNPVQIKANSYLRDYDNFNGLADHMPIVVEFTYVNSNATAKTAADYDSSMNVGGNVTGVN